MTETLNGGIQESRNSVMDTKERERQRWHSRQDRILGKDRCHTPGRTPSLTQEQVDQLLILYDSRWTIRALATYFQRAPSTILRYVNQHRIPRHQKSPLARRYRPKMRANWWEVGNGDVGADTELLTSDVD